MVSTIFFRAKWHSKTSMGTPLMGGIECRWGRQKSRFWACIWLYCLLLTLHQAGVENRVVSEPLPLSRKYECDTSLVVSGGVDCVRKRRNVYDKKYQRSANDNRTAFISIWHFWSKNWYETVLDVLYFWSRGEASRGFFATAELYLYLLYAFELRSLW